MENQSLALTLGVGVLFSFALFFFIYKGLKKSGKMAALLTILITQAIYIPLSVLYWDGLDVYAIHFAFFSMTAYGLGIITGNREARAQREGLSKVGWFHWVPAVIVGFFLVLAAVDSTIITLANKGASADFVRQFLPEPQRQSAKEVTSAFPGTVSNDFQKKYDLYNSHLSQLQTQRERGWKITNGWLETPYAGKSGMFRIHVADKQGQAIAGGKVQISFLRPSDKNLDVQYDLMEFSPGDYGQPISLNAPGRWSVVITITRGDEVHEVKGETWVEENQ